MRKDLTRERIEELAATAIEVADKATARARNANGQLSDPLLVVALFLLLSGSFDE